MNEVQNLLKSLRLKSQKLELSAVQDIETDFDKQQQALKELKQLSNQSEYQARQARNLLEEYNDFARALKDSRDKAENNAKLISGIAKSIERAANKAEEAYKELGVKMPSDLSKKIQEAKNAVNESKRLSDSIDVLPVV